MIEEDVKRGHLVQVLPEQLLPIEMPLNAVYYSDQVVSNRLRCFIDFISHKLEK